MPYVKCNKQGEVTQLLDAPKGSGCVWLELDDSDVVAFLRMRDVESTLKQTLLASDGDMVRVVEDLIDLLMDKQVFVFTELPQAVQDKLNERKRLRHDVNELSNLISDDENIL